MVVVLFVVWAADVEAAGIVPPTRVTAYDWQCQDSSGARISDHQRVELAMVACLNNSAGAFVQGGRYRINKVVVVNGSATLSWASPTQNTDGSALTNLAGYRIIYGTSASALTQSIQVMNPAVTTYIVSNLAPGTYYFAVIALTPSAESAPSNTASKSI